MTPIETVLDALNVCGCNPRQNGSGWSAACPVHDDRHPSLSVSEGSDGRVLIVCHAGDGCSFADIAAALNLDQSAFFPSTQKKAHTMNITATYDYTDESGDLLFQAVRLEPKDFRQRRPDGRGGWIWNLEGVLRVPYSLRHVIATAEAGGTIYITEGEKDADAAVLAGVCATTCSMGAGKWKDAYSEYLRGAGRVVVIADRDDEGRAGARQTATSVSNHVENVTIVEPIAGNDLSDHLNAGHAIDDLRPLDPADTDVVDQALPEPEVIDGTSIDGAALLDELHDVLTDFIIWPNNASSIAYTLWVAATHAQNVWEHATRFVLTSPIKRCGKTRVEEVGRELVHQPLPTANISPAALTRSIDDADTPTIIMDEADAIFGRGKNAREGAEDLRGILNAGHSRGWPYIRWDAQSKRREECPTFAMAMLAGIGDLPDTIQDRAVVVSMRRRAPGEQIRPFRRRRVVPGLRELRDRIHAWVTAHVEDLEFAEPDLPVEDRQADVWEPLVSIADLAGGEWPERSRAACQALCPADTDEEDTFGERLLADLRSVWAGHEEHLFTTMIIERLCQIEEAPWSDYFGKPLTARGLAKLLRPYGVTSRTVRVGTETAKGYTKDDLADSWRRYVTTVTASHEDEIAGMTRENSSDGPVTQPDFSSVTPSDQPEDTKCDPVTDVTEERPNSDPRRFTR